MFLLQPTSHYQGVIECRNFVLPATSTIRVSGALTIRCSGTADILGNVLTFYPTITPPYADINFGGGNSRDIVLSGDRSVDFAGNAVRSNRRSTFYNGVFDMRYYADSTAANTAIYFQILTTGLNFDMAANGGEFKVHAAGRITVGNNVQINMTAKQATQPSAYTSIVTGTGHPISTLFPPQWGWSVAYSGSQGAAGNIILQSVTGLDIRQGAVLNCKGSNAGWAYLHASTQAGVTSQPQPLGNNWFKPGAAGGGGIWLHAPVIDSHVTAVYDVSAGTMAAPSGTNLYYPGVGGVGKGYSGGATLNTTTEAKPGTLTSNIGIPVEF